MEFSVRAARVEDCKDIRRLILVSARTWKTQSRVGQVSRIYLRLQLYKNTSTSYKCNWEREANTALTEDDWPNICEINSSTTSSGKWTEFPWKNIIRFFITPRRRYLQSGRTECGRCWRQCNNVMADHCHIFWCCPVIQLAVVKEINSILGFDTEYNFHTVHLCNLPADLSIG